MNCVAPTWLRRRSFCRLGWSDDLVLPVTALRLLNTRLGGRPQLACRLTLAAGPRFGLAEAPDISLFRHCDGKACAHCMHAASCSERCPAASLRAANKKTACRIISRNYLLPLLHSLLAHPLHTPSQVVVQNAQELSDRQTDTRTLQSIMGWAGKFGASSEIVERVDTQRRRGGEDGRPTKQSARIAGLQLNPASQLSQQRN